eukprot:COSAG04_NODE_4744_length_1915_cov_3.098568_2_plen_97_part_00
MVVGTNQHGYVFGGYSGVAWDDGSGWVTEDEGQFIFRLAGPGLGAEAWNDTGSGTWHNTFQSNRYWYSHSCCHWVAFLRRLATDHNSTDDESSTGS